MGPGRPRPIDPDVRRQRWFSSTPPSQGRMLKQALHHGVPVDLRLDDGASHFSFMHVPPPHVEETLADRDAFLARPTAEVVMFAIS